MKLNLNQLIDPLNAKIIMAADGTARLDLHGVPRVDSLLTGKPVEAVPELVTRLCGLCPVTHHLAGMAALYRLAGVRIPLAAQQIRSLLHHGSVLVVLGQRLLHYGIDAGQSRNVIALGRAAQQAVGMTGYFPTVACPGGVTTTAVNLTELPALIAAIGKLPAPTTPGLPYQGVNVFVADKTGQCDPLGDFLCAHDGSDHELIAASETFAYIKETKPRALAPRPQIRFRGRWREYRVGACARYPELSASAAQLRSVRESIAAIARIMEDMSPAPYSTPAVVADGVGIGLIDGPRGLLIHHYEVVHGLLQDCKILSPTAQNESWLAQLLTRSNGDPLAIERAIRAADPCLPCTAAPPGKMAIEIVEES